MSDERFRAVNDYAVHHGFRAGFPNFQEAAYDDGFVYGTYLLGAGVAEWQDVPQAEYGVIDRSDVPAMIRAANDWAALKRHACAFPTFHEADYGAGVVYGTVIVSAAAVEFYDVPRSGLGVYDMGDVPGMMRAADDWAGLNGFAAALPTFQQANYGAGVVYGIIAFKSGTVTWRDVPADLLRAYEQRNAKPLIVVLCHLSDEPPGDRQRWLDFFADGGADPSPMWAYWDDVSYGLRPSARVTDWYRLRHNRADFDKDGKRNGAKVAEWAREVADGAEHFDRCHVVVGLSASSDDHGSRSGVAVFGYADDRPFEPNFMAHEMGHMFGLDHSFGEKPAPCAQGDFGNRPGAYCDPWDLMSWHNVKEFKDERGRESGPGLAAPNLVRLGWLHRSRVWRGFPMDMTVLQLAALNRPDVDGYLAARIQATVLEPPIYLEYRHQSGWDIGLPSDAVLVHGTAGGLTRLLTTLSGGELHTGQEVVLPALLPVVVRVDAIDQQAAGATVRIWPLPPGAARNVRIVRIIYNPAGVEWAGEYVLIRNDTSDEFDVTGWTLDDVAGHIYRFPARNLDPGHEVRVWTAPGQDDRDNLYWGRHAAVWNDAGDTATLRRADSSVVSRFSYGTGG